MIPPAVNPRELAIRRAREIIDAKPIYIDTETTGLGKDAEIIELAVVDDDGQVLLNQLFRPQLPIPPEATRLHKITNEMVAGKPLWGIYWPTIRVSKQRSLWHPARNPQRFLRDEAVCSIPRGVGFAAQPIQLVSVGAGWGGCGDQYPQFSSCCR